MKAFCLLTASVAALISAGAARATTTDPVPAPADAQAQTTTDPAAAATDTAGKTDIVVTAERRSTSLQKTGVAATVLTGEDLTRKSINGVEQLQFASPSLTVNTTGQGNAFNIRGIGKTEQTSAIGVGVVTYRDGVATLPGYFQSEPYYDIASVEVLRGPQGTFAGGNATGGAIFITEKNPDVHSVNGYALAQYGNYNDVKVQGAINLPMSSTLALRVAGNFENRDTFYTVTGGYTGNPGNRRDRSGRASLLWEPSSNFRLLLKGDYNNIEYGGLPASAATATGDPLVVANNAYLNGRDEFGRGVLNMAYTTDGGVTFRSISGYQKGTTQINYDGDGTAAVGTSAKPALAFKDHISEEIFSQEFNIVSPNTGPFTWLIGGYYQHDEIYIPANGGYYSDATPGSFANLDIEIVGTNPKTALAAFGQVGYELTDGLQLTVGGRWSRTTSANDAVARAYITELSASPLAQLVQNDKTVNKKVNGKVALNWTVNPNNFLYAFVATGTKAGGLNGPNLAGQTPLAFAPEDVTDFELGWKGTFADGHLRTQLGGYYNLYKKFQVNIVDPRSTSLSSLYNVPGNTRLYGIEASMQGNFDHFSFDFSTSISNSKLGTFYAIDPRISAAGQPVCNPTTGPVTTRCLALTGHEQNYAPKFTLSAGVQYVINLGDKTTLTPRIDYSHIDAVWGSLFQNAALGDRIQGRDIFNAQLNLVTGPWSFGAYSTNFTNQHYVGAINGIRRLAGAPRQYGLRVSRSF
jgi:iron complex outermembrane receptor protein